MIIYKLGKVVWKNTTTIIFENNFTGYKVNIVRNEDYELDKFTKIFIYVLNKTDQKNNHSQELYGFKTIFQRNVFADLLAISGIGPITAMHIMSNDLNKLCADIINSNIENLTTFNFVNRKVALLLCSNLSDKYAKIYADKINNPNTNLLVEGLKKLGYKKQDINFALKNIKDHTLDLDILISQSIKSISLNNE